MIITIKMSNTIMIMIIVLKAMTKVITSKMTSVLIQMMAILLSISEILHSRLEERKIHGHTWKGVDQLCQSLNIYEAFFSIHTWALFSDAKVVPWQDIPD